MFDRLEVQFLCRGRKRRRIDDAQGRRCEARGL